VNRRTHAISSHADTASTYGGCESQFFQLDFTIVLAVLLGRSMQWSIDEMTDVRDLVGQLLDDAGLRSYVFDVEQDKENWIISVDFPHRDEWQAVDLRVDKQVLRDCLKRPEARQTLGSTWKDKFANLS
jgi:hypothetical protein